MKLDAMFFGSHPDDVELTSGGTVAKLTQRGYQIGIVDLTRGEAGTRGSAEIRDKEAAEAGKILGVTVRENLEFTDTQIANTRDNQLKIIRILRLYRPEIIFIPYWDDRHPDHVHSSHLCREAAFFSGLRRIESIHMGQAQDAFRPNQIIYCRARFDFSRESGYPFIVDISDTFALKMKAVDAYASQFHNINYATDEPVTHISTPEFLELIEVRARHFGSLIGARYGEPFLSREIFNLDDPIKFFS